MLSESGDEFVDWHIALGAVHEHLGVESGSWGHCRAFRFLPLR